MAVLVLPAAATPARIVAPDLRLSAGALRFRRYSCADGRLGTRRPLCALRNLLARGRIGRFSCERGERIIAPAQARQYFPQLRDLFAREQLVSALLEAPLCFLHQRVAF